MVKATEKFHPELNRVARWIPRISFTARLGRFVRFVQRLRGVPKAPSVQGMAIDDVIIPGADGASRIRVRLYRPTDKSTPGPAMLWIHGGGFVIGTPEQHEAQCIAMCRELGMIIAAVSYRLSPDDPYPAALDDCYAALVWLHGRAAELGVAADRIAIGGNSAGAGLAAGLVLLAYDRGAIPIAFQLLTYPMLDDRTTRRRDIDQARLRMWNSKSNLYGWTSYLGGEPGGGDVPDYAAPARRQDLSSLPPAWIGVGTCDLFHDENLTYAQRLTAAGVPCTLKVVEGAFHGFDLVCPGAPVVREFRESYMKDLRKHLCEA